MQPIAVGTVTLHRNNKKKIIPFTQTKKNDFVINVIN